MEHRKGSLNVVPDTLSRFDVDELDSKGYSAEIDLMSPEFNNHEYEELKDNIKKNSKALPDLHLQNNHIFKRVKFRSEEDDENSLWRLWLPKPLVEGVVRSAHEEGCHGGFNKTLFRIRQKYFWPRMAHDIKAYIAKCETCKSIKPTNQILRPPMGNQMLTFRPFQRLYCDFLGPYPCTSSKNTQLFIVMDHFTKFLFLKPLKSATSANVMEFFYKHIFCTFGVPQFIHSDNAKQFISKEMQDFFAAYGITHVTTGFYSPQANASERANREIVSKIRYFLKDHVDHTKWDREIPKILQILRSDFHSAIKCSPYFAVFGQNMILNGSSYEILDQLNMLTDDTVVEHTDKLQFIREKIRKNLDIAHEKACKTYNTRCKPVNYIVGQEVFRKNHVQSDFKKAVNAKFCPKYIKCRIRSKIGHSLYELEDLRGNYLGKYHASDIRSG